MSEPATRRNLGRGLSALLGSERIESVTAAPEAARAPRAVPIETLHPGAFQPRRRFDEAEIESLAESIRANGVLQPILVRRHPRLPNAYEIVAGERRWRAAQRAGLHEVPIILRAIADAEAVELALVENIQRQDLNALEEGEGYRRLIEEFGNTQEVLARRVGKSRSHVANTLRLLGLPEPVKRMLEDGRLTAGHARALLGAKDPAAIAERVVARGLNVRQTEALVKAERAGAKPSAPPPAKDANTLALERELAASLGLRVVLSHGPKGGTLTLHYRTLDQLDALIARLKAAAPVQA
ncbi:MAG: ParB/RepB/Spo0J family partition protein [Rhodospirillaceae bacterium]|nr:ParB/RepB/Spo0J family partition protein [Rhodospirillaceae bacterium]